MLTAAQILQADPDAELARRHHLDFMQLCWQKQDKLIVGRHTAAICERIDKAITEYDAGNSTYLIVKVPFRHGKSDIVPRYLAPHFLGRYPNDEIMVATYSADLANSLSIFARNLIRTPEYARVYPHIKLSSERANIQNWKIEQYQGETHWAGVGGAQTGKGFNLGIIDDYLKNRQDAESVIIRDKQWEWFTNSFLTRTAPVSIVIILATPWHVDDIIGRIEKKMADDPDFPQFEVIRYPAFDDSYPEGILFPERFKKKWYVNHKSALGPYGTASLLQCDPQAREGNLFKVNKIKFTEELPTGLVWVRAWDLASTEKQLIKSDPDWTVGVRMGIEWEKREEVDELIPHVYIAHVERMREDAPERNRAMMRITEMDGIEVKVAIECVAAYKDTVTQMQELFDGIREVTAIEVVKDKLVRAVPMEIAMEAGNVTLLRGDWNEIFIDELAAFPSGKHDDQVDAMSTGYEYLKDHANDIDWDKLSGVEVKKKA
jgi:predicted phage terminase large subunit-like protein